jgi:hypothetical protein
VNAKGRYKCDNPAKKSLTDKQRDLLNDMYNDYNQVYSHWFADDYDTAMIDNLLKESKRNFKKWNDFN